MFSRNLRDRIYRAGSQDIEMGIEKSFVLYQKFERFACFSTIGKEGKKGGKDGGREEGKEKSRREGGKKRGKEG